jgi:hypothetical protein
MGAMLALGEPNVKPVGMCTLTCVLDVCAGLSVHAVVGVKLVRYGELPPYRVLAAVGFARLVCGVFLDPFPVWAFALALELFPVFPCGVRLELFLGMAAAGMAPGRSHGCSTCQ